MEAMKGESYEAPSPDVRAIGRHVDRMEKAIEECHQRADRLEAQVSAALSPSTPANPTEMSAVREMQSPLADRLLDIITRTERLSVRLADLTDRAEL